jgi:hypothetical protein
VIISLAACMMRRALNHLQNQCEVESMPKSPSLR